MKRNAKFLQAKSKAHSVKELVRSTSSSLAGLVATNTTCITTGRKASASAIGGRHDHAACAAGAAT